MNKYNQSSGNPQHNSVYEIVNEKILAKLNAGKIPWKKPWINDGSMPMNLISKKEYRGMNLWLLPDNYQSPYFVSFKQAQEVGGTIKKGESGNLITFWKVGEKSKINENGESKTEKTFLLRYYYVWNTEQTTIPADKIPKINVAKPDFNPIESCESLVATMPNPPEITHNEARAYYQPSSDTVNMPKKNLFADERGYYATIFHELSHSTGHISRLNRKDIVGEFGFASQAYSREELVAELSSAYLCNVAGIEKSIENTVAYIQSWIKFLKDDTKAFCLASSGAQKSADYILNRNQNAEMAT